MHTRITDIIAGETHGFSYKTLKYGLDHFEVPESDEAVIVWQNIAEPSQKSKYIDLQPLSQTLALSGEQILTYFLDGSRKVCKVDDIAYELSGGRKVIYPVMAGQIVTGICKRVCGKLFPEKCNYEIVISLPETADYDNGGKSGFWQGLTQKLSTALTSADIGISEILSYKTGRAFPKSTFEDRGTAMIQTRMIEVEKELTEYLVRTKLLNHKNYLVKDGTLEYRKKADVQFQTYRWVIGLSKSFNPEACLNARGKPDPSYIANLPVNHRTQVACFSNPDFLGDALYAVWYIRLRESKRVASPFDGIVKAEKMLVTHEEKASHHVNSDEIDTLSAYILNERSPVCFGKDTRWLNHIYPVYLTEQYIKSKYISAESFMHLF